MTTEPNVPEASYTVASAGPFAIGWPYGIDTVTAYAVVAGARLDLIPGTDFTVVPTASETTGNLTLSPAMATALAGATLYLVRQTPDQQGWIGTLGQREKGLEAQLDQLTRRAQEVGAAQRRTLVVPPGETTLELPAVSDRAARFLAFDALGRPVAATPDPSGAPVDVSSWADNHWTGLNRFGDDLTVDSDVSLFVGSGEEAEVLYSTPSAKLIARAKTAAIWFSQRFSNFELVNFDNTKSFLRAYADAAVELFFNGQKRLETDASGVIVAGRLRETARDTEKWHTVTRTAGTYYQNSTGRMIRVSVRGVTGGSAGTLNLSVNDAASDNIIAAETRAATQYAMIYADVPPAHFYRMLVTGGMTVDLVQELS